MQFIPSENWRQSAAEAESPRELNKKEKMCIALMVTLTVIILACVICLAVKANTFIPREYVLHIWIAFVSISILTVYTQTQSFRNWIQT